MWTRWGDEWVKNVFFVHAGSGEGGRKMAKNFPHSCWMPPYRCQISVTRLNKQVFFYKEIWISTFFSIPYFTGFQEAGWSSPCLTWWSFAWALDEVQCWLRALCSLFSVGPGASMPIVYWRKLYHTFTKEWNVAFFLYLSCEDAKSSGFKHHEILVFKVNLLCQKNPNIFDILIKKI